MKSYKIKKRIERRQIYLSDPPIRPFDKPKFKIYFFSNIHPPSLYEPLTELQISVEQVETNN